jgi:hypothetical protein
VSSPPLSSHKYKSHKLWDTSGDLSADTHAHSGGGSVDTPPGGGKLGINRASLPTALGSRGKLLFPVSNAYALGAAVCLSLYPVYNVYLTQSWSGL